ncbi:MAG: acyl-CoA thioester hydrolase YciA [Rhodospirillales bacterium]|nr:acyl-CoA thioester hydrolase YciA [Rhodospirillales bacterium]
MSKDSTDNLENKRGTLSIRTLAMPADTNPNGDIFGGWLMSQMDIAGGITAHARASGRVVTVGVEAMTFHLPVRVGDVVCCYTDIVKVGKTSLTISVEVWALRERDPSHTVKVTEGLYTYVAIDDDGNKRLLPAA